MFSSLLHGNATFIYNRRPRSGLWLAARNAPNGDLRVFERLIKIYQSRILPNWRYLTKDNANYENLAQ